MIPTVESDSKSDRHWMGTAPLGEHIDADLSTYPVLMKTEVSMGWPTTLNLMMKVHKQWSAFEPHSAINEPR